MKENKSFLEEITSTINEYILHNLNVEPIDGIFITEDLSISLVMEEDICVLGDYYRMEDLVSYEERGGKVVAVPNQLALKEIADFYIPHK